MVFSVFAVPFASYLFFSSTAFTSSFLLGTIPGEQGFIQRISLESASSHVFQSSQARREREGHTAKRGCYRGHCRMDRWQRGLGERCPENKVGSPRIPAFTTPADGSKERETVIVRRIGDHFHLPNPFANAHREGRLSTLVHHLSSELPYSH